MQNLFDNDWKHVFDKYIKIYQNFYFHVDTCSR